MAKKITAPARSVQTQSVGASKAAKKKTAKKSASNPKPRLLSGENPQIAKGDGNKPVKDYIKAIPGWKQKIAKRVDEIISETLPEVIKAVKWNSPFYSVDGSTWIISMHCFKNYVKVAFFKGVYLTPALPGQSKQKEVRYIDITEEGFDEKQFAKWVVQAATFPGWKP